MFNNMLKNWIPAFALLVVFVVLSAIPAMAAPTTMRFQGRLTDSQGRPIVGNPQVRFEIFNAATGGALVWGPSSYLGVTSNEAGLFSVDIDLGVNGASTFAAPNDLFLQVTVKAGTGGQDQILSPRQKLSSVPYAFYAQTASSASTAGTANSVADNSISNSKLQDNSVNSLKILDRSILSIDLSTGSVTSNNIADGSISNVDIEDETITLAKLSADILASWNLLVPKGVIVAYGGTTPPTGWFLCNGQAVSRTTYGALFSVIGTAFGNGNGSTTFNLPDFRGRFLRGVDQSAGRDPDTAGRSAMNPGGATGDNIGSIQNDQFGSHNHSVTDPGHAHQIWGDITTTLLGGGRFPTAGQNSLENMVESESATTSITVNSAGGSESRPKNAFVNYIIKY
ncbi:MAG: hypothetical protein KCHDKBKB_02150 [Elusimicrobia bacterium]|nr:hypothetical protein [Elusimicrobiota bacterium]